MDGSAEGRIELTQRPTRIGATVARLQVQRPRKARNLVSQRSAQASRISCHAASREGEFLQPVVFRNSQAANGMAGSLRDDTAFSGIVLR